MSARIPRNWATSWHPQAAGRSGDKLAWMPGRNGAGQQPMQRTPIGAYGRKVSGIPLTGGQAQGIVPASGTITLQAGPNGLGVVWYPAQVTISTTTGLNGGIDTSNAVVYQGPTTILNPTWLVGQVNTGNGTAALALPNMTPGQVVTVVWTGAHPGDTASFNIVGLMDALTTGR